MNISQYVTNDWTEILPQLPADVLQPIAKTYGAKRYRGRDECLQYLLGLLNDPEQMREAVEALPPLDRQVLAAFRRFGGLSGMEEADLTLAASGLREGVDLGQPDPTGEFVAGLIQRGLVVDWDPLRHPVLRSGYGVVCVDPRVMEWAGDSSYRPIELEAVSPPAITHYRRPHEVLFMVEDLLRQVSAQGGLSLTQAGDIRAPDRRKLVRGLDWGDASDLGALPFPGLPDALVNALLLMGILAVQDGRLRPSGAAAPVPVAARAERIAVGFIVSPRPLACEPTALEGTASWHGWGVAPTFSRLAILTALGALSDPDQFHSLDDFSQALFARIGPDYFQTYLGSQARWMPRLSAGEERERILRRGWAEREHVVIEQALGTWLHALGMVEVGLRDGHVAAFRITDLGRAALTGAWLIEQPAADKEAWVVQPNLEIVAWLDRAEADDLALLECFAERTQVRDHTLHYALTRQSVHAGMQRGGTVDELLEGLAAGSQVELPQNVVAEIHEWAEVRDRLVLRRGANLLEFWTEEERDAALAKGIPGQPVGESFILLPDTPPTLEAIAQALETECLSFSIYGRVPERSIRLKPDGTARVSGVETDLQTDGLLERWFERRQDGTWQLTEASVKRAVAAGAPPAELNSFLGERTFGVVPGPLEIAMRAWAGRKSQMRLERSALIHCKSARQRSQLLEDPTIRRCAVSSVGDAAILVSEENLPAVMDRLKWAGVDVVGAEPYPAHPPHGKATT